MLIESVVWLSYPRFMHKKIQIFQWIFMIPRISINNKAIGYQVHTFLENLLSRLLQLELHGVWSIHCHSKWYADTADPFDQWKESFQNKSIYSPHHNFLDNYRAHMPEIYQLWPWMTCWTARWRCLRKKLGFYIHVSAGFQDKVVVYLHS